MNLNLAETRLLFSGRHVPRNPLQVQNKNRVKDRDQEQRDEGSDGESANLGIAERLPERPPFERERKQSKDGRPDGDHYRTNALNAGIGKSTFEWFALFVHLLDEIEEHDHVADDDANEAGNPKECHEPEWRAHDRQCDQRSDRSVRCGRKHKQGLDGILELKEQSQLDAYERDEEDDGEIHESIDLLRFLTSDLQLISRRKPILKIFQFGFDRSKDFRREDSGRRKTQYRNRAKMLAAPYATRFKNIPDGGNRKQRNSSVLLRGINIETLDLRQLCTVLRAQTGNDRDALVAFFECSNWRSADRGCGRIGYISVRDTDQVRAIRINLNLYLQAVGSPIIPQHRISRRLSKNIHCL